MSAAVKTIFSSGTTSTGTGEHLNSLDFTVQAVVTGTGAVTAAIDLEVALDGSAGFMKVATITLTGTDTATDGFAGYGNWESIRAKLTSITGTGAVCTVYLGE